MQLEESEELIPESEILAALERTGFLLEQNVAQFFLRQSNFEVIASRPFLDVDSGKSREVDVYAWWSDPDATDESPAFLTASFVVECKNTANPFVLIGSKQSYPTRYPWYRNRYKSFLDPFALGWEGFICAIDYLELDRLPGAMPEHNFVASQLVRLEKNHGKWRADNSGVYDGIIYPLAKAGVAYAAELAEVGLDTPSYQFFFPLLVTNGPVYIVDTGSSGSAARRVKWAPLARRFDGEYLRGEYLFEVVEFEYLHEYFDDRAMKYVHNAKKRFEERAKSLDLDWLLKKHGRPTQLEEFQRMRDIMASRSTE